MELISLVLLYTGRSYTWRAKLGPHNIETVYSTHCPGREEQTGSLFIVVAARLHLASQYMILSVGPMYLAQPRERDQLLGWIRCTCATE